jgi:DNA-binding CsgD family transcriptional regulator/tetratricopeptide (TPR) repeat protein/type II secretory pathway predicted ATPase ExeA
VGRETQVDQLLGALSRARAGVPGIVLVRGEAGSGKSRLLREFLSLARDGRATTLYGACIDVSAGDIPLVPFRTALRHLVQGSSTTDMASLLGGTWRDLHVLLPELAPSDVHGVNAAPHVFEVVSAVVARLAGERPVVIAVDDAQWADQSTLQLLRYLTQSGQPLPLLVLVAYRGEELPSEPGRRKAFEELSRAADDDVTVTPLSGEQITDLVRRLGIELSSASMRRLLTRSAGLPFLVEELAAAEQDGVTKGIPNRVRDVVRLRLGALSQEAQLVVALVAVAARPLRHRVLAEAAHLPARVFAEALDEALSAHLLVADTDERTYGFRHDVAREIVHEDLLTSSRMELHVRLAVAMQADLPVDAYAGRLCEVAHHWLQTEANEEHALRASLLAARASTRAFAHPEALRQYGHVIALWSRVGDPDMIVGTDLVAVSIEAAEAGHWAGDAEAALRHIDRAIEAADTSDESLMSTLQARRTLYAWLATGQRARGPDLLVHIGSVATRERMRASDLMQAGRYGESVDVAGRAIELARVVESWDDEYRALLILGVGQGMTGRVTDGIATLDTVITEAAQRGDGELVIAARNNLIFVLLGDGQMSAAATLALRGVEEATARGTGGSEGALLAANAAEALIRLGRLAEAERVIQDALDAKPPGAVANVLLLGRAELDVLTGRFLPAAESLRAIVARGVMEDYQFDQQMRAVEAELQLWDPAPRHDILLGRLHDRRGSAIPGAPGEDLPLAVRLMWLGVRADADARALAEIQRDQARLQELTDDGAGLVANAAELAAKAASAGVRLQLDRFLALIAGETSRLLGRPDPDVWATAAAAAEPDPYLHSYALWRQGSALRALRRRREAAACLRAAYEIAHETGMRTVADAVVAAGRALGISIEHAVPARSSAAKAARPFGMTAKEVQVLELLARGLTNRRIATALHMTEKTASVHVSHILAKMSVRNRGEAAARAYEVGFVVSPGGQSSAGG